MSYFMNENSTKDVYELLETGITDKIIRHYKIIKKHSDHNINKDLNNESYVIDDINELPIDYINIYNDEGYNSANLHKDELLSFSKYNTINALQNKLDNDKIRAIEEYVNDLIKDPDEYENTEFGNQIRNVVNQYDNYKHLYIRFAPSIEQKDTQIKLALYKHQIYTPYNDSEYISRIIVNEKMPKFNDNLVYSESKCKYAINKVNELDKNEYSYLFYYGYLKPENDFDINNMISYNEYNKYDVIYDYNSGNGLQLPDEQHLFYIAIPTFDRNNIRICYDVYNNENKYNDASSYFNIISMTTKINNVNYTIYESCKPGKFYGKIQIIR